jgi:hypothetical protein
VRRGFAGAERRGRVEAVDHTVAVQEEQQIRRRRFEEKKGGRSCFWSRIRRRRLDATFR